MLNKTIVKYLLLTAAFFLCSFASADDKNKIVLQLKWLHSFQFAGYYAAIEKGFYAEENLDVTLKERNPEFDPVDEVLNGRADYGITDSGLVLSELKNNALVLVAQIFQHSPLVLLTRQDGKLRTPFDLKGKKVSADKTGITDPSILALLLNLFGDLDAVELLPTSYRNDDLVEEKLDALSAYSTSQPFYFKQKNIPVNIIDPRDYGIDFYGDNLFTSKYELKHNATRIERVRSATLKGWKYALDHPGEIIDLILRKYNSQGFARAHLEYEARETAKMIVPEYFELGSFEVSRYDKIIETFAQLGVTDRIKLDPDFFFRPLLPSLSESERIWLSHHPRIEIGIMKAWPPFDFVNNKGVPSGIGVSFIEALNKRLGGVLVPVPGEWEDIYDMVKHKQRPALMDITPKAGRESDFIFTKPYLAVPHVIVGRKGMPYIKNEQDLIGKIVALEHGFGNVDYFTRHYPEVTVKQFSDTSQALDAVVRGVADAYVGNRAVVNYLIKHEVMLSLEVQGRLKREASELTIGVRKDWPILRDILQKAMDSLTQVEMNMILSPWILNGTANKQTPSLTEEEKSWLSEHKVIRIAMDPDWAPIEYINDAGDFDGISLDYLELISQYTGVSFEGKKGLSWQQGVAAVEAKRLDMFSSVSVTPERQAFTQFTQPYISFPIKIYAQEKSPYFSSMDGLYGKKVAVVEGYAIESWLRRDHPELELTQVSTPLQGLRMVSKGEVDVFVGNVITATYYLRKHAIENVRMSGDTPYQNNQAMAVRDDWPILVGILQKALDSISQLQHDLIFNRWMSVRFEKAIDYGLIWMIVLVALLLILLVAYWNRRLSQEVQQRKNVEAALRDHQQNLEHLVLERTKALSHLANHDALTGLPNRLLFSDRLTQAIKAADRQGSRIAILFIDLDNFKRVNDSFDHSHGDNALKLVAKRFKTVIRKEDTLARMGGDEFTLILNSFENDDDVAHVANKIIGLFHEPFFVQEHQVFLGASIGISLYPLHGATVEDLVRNADAAMYKAKVSGRNNFKYYSDDLTEKALEQFLLENNLRNALESQEFVLHYQPQIDLQSGNLCGLEALVRWQHPEAGLIPPIKFISLAEHTGLIVPLGEWILNEACAQMYKWHESGVISRDVPISVNLSAVQFDQEGLVDSVVEAHKNTGLHYSQLELEITESTMMNNPEYSKNMLNQLRGLGVKLAIDDFGTGYSSLSHLKLLPLTRLKIDRSFVSNIPEDANDVAISKAVISLAQGLSLDVLAEGIETKEQLEFLSNEGCNSGQGYLFSKPLSADDLVEFVISGNH